MPTVAVSSQVAEAVYFVSIIGLSVMLARPTYLVYSASQERGAQVVASAIGAMFDSMSPGTTVRTSLESYPGVQLVVALGGTSLRASFGGASATVSVRWDLPDATLTPGTVYSFTLQGAEVAVAPARDG